MDLSGLGQLPVMNTVDRSACSKRGEGITRQQTTPTPVSLRLFVLLFSLVGATRLAGGTYRIAGLDSASMKRERHSQKWQQNVHLVYI